MIYIFCPANCMTGGPELLHQLGYKLRLLGFEAEMYYCMNRQEGVSPTPAVYLKYNVPYAEAISDKRENIVIIPEITFL